MANTFNLGLRGKTTILLSGLISLALIVINFANYWQAKDLAEKKVILLEQSKFVRFKDKIELTLDNHTHVLMSLRDVPPIQSILRIRSNKGAGLKGGGTLEEWHNRLKVIFLAFMTNNTEYQQLRFISVAGDELVRIQRTTSGDVTVTAENELQNKSESAYVRETVKLKVGETYYSDVTLNREYGVIQVPHVPVLRIATPVFDSNGHVSALMVLNLSIERTFENINSEVNGMQRYIVDDKGYYLKHPNDSKTFGFERGFDYKLQSVKPDMANISLSRDKFIERNERHNDLDGFQKIFFSPLDHSRYWLLVFNIPEKIMFSDTNATLERMLVFSFFVGLALIILVVWVTSKKIMAPILTMAAAYESFKRDDLTVRLDAASVHDEFITLYKGINTFVENQQQATSHLTKEVAAQTERLSAVINNIVDGLITISERGIIETFNPAASAIFGYSAEEVIGQNVKMLMPENYSKEHDGYLDNFITTGIRKVIGTRELVGSHKDGTIFPMELAISELYINGIRHFVGITRDITERIQAEIELEKSRRKYHDIVENTPDIITRVNLEGSILFINHASNEIYGLEAEDCIGRSAFDFIHPDDLTKTLLGFEIWISSDEKVFVHENRQISIDGIVHHILWSICKEFNDKGVVFGFVSIGRDITEHKRIEQQLQTHQRMDSLGTLAGGISHDFNNILGALQGNLELLNLNNGNFNEKQNKFLENATLSTHRAVELIKQFQTLTTVTANDKTIIDVYNIVEEVFNLLGQTTNKLIKKEIKFKKETFYVSANSGELHQVLLNLATNSAYSIEERGVTNNDYIRVEAEKYQESSYGKVELTDGEYVHLSFKDTGKGMSTEVLKKAFDPLFTTKDKGIKRGQGLGLAMVYNIITKHHHGLIEVTSEEDKGTTFHIYLPKAQSEILIDRNKNVEVQGGTETLLLVDDDEMVASLAEEILTDFGYTVLIANDGIEALNIYAQKMDLISAVILDLNMPNMSGKEVFQKMQKLNPEVRVIISSGYGVEHSQEGILSKAKGNLSKPYKLDDLSHVVRDVLEL